MKYLTLSIISFWFLADSSLPQGTAGEKAKYEYRYLIDLPTAGILEKGVVGFTSDILPDGVLIASLEAGVLENLSFGISYGGANLIGSGKVDWYKLPAVNIRFRILNETILLPALAIGFDSQGKGTFDNEAKRYSIKSPGFFASVSKNFNFLGYLSLHGSVNYSLENNDGDNFINLKGGVEKTLGSSFSILLEYDLALNDNNNELFGEGRGYFNTGLRWVVGDDLTVGFDLRDLLSNKSSTTYSADRSLRIEFIKNIF